MWGFMTRTDIYHALGLHLHQPPGNLRLMMEANPCEAEEIIRCYDRVPRYALLYGDVARLHVGFSGVLLEQLLDPDIVDRYRHIVDIPAMLQRYRDAENIELIGMGYYHPIFPLTPRADWSEHLSRDRSLAERIFGRAQRGFWPPEMAFTMGMIPALIEAGYEYVIVDGVHVRPEDGINDVFRPYLACHEGVCITVVPLDRGVSTAQESGLDSDWFRDEVTWCAAHSPRPDEKRLVTTWSGGENRGWFRRTEESSGFFGRFFAPYMEQVRAGTYPVTPVRLSDYLEEVSPSAYTQIQTGTWNVGSAPGHDLSRWADSESQRDAIVEVSGLSARYWDLMHRFPDQTQVGGHALSRARRLILEAETSCFLFWGDSWIPYLHMRTREAASALDEAEHALSSVGQPPEQDTRFALGGVAE
jgi:hypothetical protein